MSRRIKAQKRELHDAIAEGQAVMEVNDTYFLRSAKRMRRSLVSLNKSGHDPFAAMEEACCDIDGLTLHYLQAELISTKGESVR